MQKNLHPTWHHDSVVTCACGNSFTTGGTKKTLQVDICSACHPFFTGEMRFVDTQGRVDKFRQKMERAQATQSKKSKKQKNISGPGKSYQQILSDQKKQVQAVKAASKKATDDDTSSTSQQAA